MFTIERNLLFISPVCVLLDIELLFAILRNRFDAINRDLNLLLRKSPLSSERRDLQSVPFVAPVLAKTLFADRPR